MTKGPLNPREIPDIQEGEALLKEAESAFPSARSAGRFGEGIDTLNFFLDADDPPEVVRTFVQNLKYAYTRRLLAGLKDIPVRQVDVLFPYLTVLFFRAKTEFDALRLSHPDLGREFDECLERFRPQLEDMIRETR